MKKFLKKSLVVVLALVLSFGSAASVYAKSSNAEYISDIKAGYADEGKNRLLEEGYTLFDFDANEGSFGDSVYIGYKTTKEKSEAITDLALMNMNGGYSFGAWRDEVKALQEQVDQLLYDFSSSIKEYRNNLNANDPYAVLSLTYLNKYYDSYSNKTLGDLFKDSSTTQETLNNIFLMGNSDIVQAIESTLAFALTVKDGTTFTQRLEEEEYTGELDPGMNKTRQSLFASLATLQKTVIDGEAAIAKAESMVERFPDIYDSIGDYIQSLDIDEILLLTEKKALIQALKDTDYADTGLSFYDVVMLDPEESKEGLLLTDEVVEPLARSLSEGQQGLLGVVPMELLVTFATTESLEETVSIIYDNLPAEGTLSVYFGVDTTVYEDYETVAMTSDLLREEAKNSGKMLGVTIEERESEKNAKMYGIMAMCAGGIGLAGAMVMGFAGSAWGKTVIYDIGKYATEWITKSAYEVMGEVELKFIGGSAYRSSLTWSTSQMFIGWGITAIAIAAAVVFMVLTLLSDVQEEAELETVTHSPIPRVIVDKQEKGGEVNYINYYATANILAPDNNTDSLKLYGDMNGICKYDEWFVLYYTKNPNAGSPITAESLIVTGEYKDPGEGWFAVHEFGELAAANFNKYTHSSNRVNHYLYLKQAPENLTGSVFSQTTLVLVSGAAFLLGVALTSIIAIRKKKTAVNA